MVPMQLAKQLVIKATAVTLPHPPLKCVNLAMLLVNSVLTLQLRIA